MKDIRKDAAHILDHFKDSGIFLCPTDTVWGLSTIMSNKNGFDRINTMKNRASDQNFILLVDTYERMSEYSIKMPQKLIDYALKSERPVSIIFEANHRVPDHAKANDGTICMRVCNNPIIQEIVLLLNQPIVSTSANLKGQVTPSNFDAIDKHIIQSVDYVCLYGREGFQNQSSKIIQLGLDDQLVVLRE